MQNFRIALVVPQMSLRKTIQRVFKRTPGLPADMVLSPFQVGSSDEPFDLLIVDETHRLRQSGNQPAGPLYAMFSRINKKLFGVDDPNLTQVDWITRMSAHQVFLLDSAQSVHTGDVPTQALQELTKDSDKRHRKYRLTSQMRVKAGEEYIDYVRAVFTDEPPSPKSFEDYEVKFFDNLGDMVQAIQEKEREVSLCRLLAGFAWPWLSKKDKTAFDFELDGTRLRWNQTDTDWVSSSTSAQEVGVIHTIQGYDLNYAGVLIGKDLRFDPAEQRLVFDRANYFDPTAANNMPRRGITFTDADILELVKNIYVVLLTRGMLGTYLYVCDEPLRERLRPYFA